MLTLSFAAYDVARLAQFWAGLLGREAVAEAGTLLLPGAEGQVSLRFVPGAGPKAGPEPVHLHLTSTDLDDQEERVATALRLGGAHLDVGQLPEESHVVLADPEGNEFCVIGPGNAFLAGCGLLGELACDGTGAVGRFWSAALYWPLVWDRDEETAIQSPSGGTKVAWGGPPLNPRTGPARLHFVLTAEGGRPAQVDRLTALGATVVRDRPDGVVLADPDGNEFLLQA